MSESGERTMYAARGVQPHERFCEAKWRPYRPTSGPDRILNAPTDGAPKNALHESVGRFFCCSILRRHDLVQRRRYSNRAAARKCRKERHSAAFSLARGRVPGNVAGVERRGDGERQGLEIKKVQVCKSVYGNNKFDGSLLRNF